MTRSAPMNDALHSQLRRTLREIAKSRGLTFENWSMLADLAEGTMRNFVNGASRSITLHTLQKLAIAVDLEVADLLKFKPKRKNRRPPRRAAGGL
jgi:DNA-binding Xre family transcriptional regulator